MITFFFTNLAADMRAIALNPKYLFCDEPNSGLDRLTDFIFASDLLKEMRSVVNEQHHKQ